MKAKAKAKVWAAGSAPASYRRQHPSGWQRRVAGDWPFAQLLLIYRMRDDVLVESGFCEKFTLPSVVGKTKRERDRYGRKKAKISVRMVKHWRLVEPSSWHDVANIFWAWKVFIVRIVYRRMAHWRTKAMHFVNTAGRRAKARTRPRFSFN